jgi:hypothetical protein
MRRLFIEPDSWRVTDGATPAGKASGEAVTSRRIEMAKAIARGEKTLAVAIVELARRGYSRSLIRSVAREFLLDRCAIISCAAESFEQAADKLKHGG